VLKTINRKTAHTLYKIALSSVPWTKKRTREIKRRINKAGWELIAAFEILVEQLE